MQTWDSLLKQDTDAQTLISKEKLQTSLRHELPLPPPVKFSAKSGLLFLPLHCFAYDFPWVIHVFIFIAHSRHEYGVFSCCHNYIQWLKPERLYAVVLHFNHIWGSKSPVWTRLLCFFHYAECKNCAAIGLACPQPFWGTLSGRFEPRAARTVSLTVITGFTVGALSAFNIFISKISVSQCLLSVGGICMYFQLIPVSFSRAPASQIIRKCPYRSVSIWKWRTRLHSWFAVFMSDWAIFFQTRFQPIHRLGQACISKPLRNTVW